MGRQLVEIQSRKVQLGETQLAETRWKRQSAGERNAAGGGREGGKAERGTGEQRGKDRTGLQPRCNRKQKRHRKFLAAPQIAKFQRHCHPLTPQEQTGSKAFNL